MPQSLGTAELLYGSVPLLSVDLSEVIGKAKALKVKGFASMAGLDRDGDRIEPGLFDLRTFLANPQLWIDHHKWKRPDGNEVNVGVVTSAVVAVAERADKTYDIRHLSSGKLIETLEDTGDLLIRSGDRGLWVTADVMEKPVADLVKEKRLNAFSWQGRVRRDDKGRLKKIDLMEVSLVHIPANARALFMLDKSLADGKPIVLAWDAEKGLLAGVLQSLPEDVEESADHDGAPQYVVLCQNEYGSVAKILCQNDPFSVEVAAEDPESTFDQMHVFRFAGVKSGGGSLLYEAVDLGEEIEDSLVLGEGIDKDFQGFLADVDAKIGDALKAVWTARFINRLPDSSFAYIEPGGEKDDTGRTVPRRLRHFPYKNMDGKVDLPHLRNALARVPQSTLSGSAKRQALRVLEAAARREGVGGRSAKETVMRGLSETERKLLALTEKLRDEENAGAAKGGEREVDKLEEQLGKITEAIVGVTSSLDGLGERVKALEDSSKEPEGEKKEDEVPEAGGEPKEETSAEGEKPKEEEKAPENEERQDDAVVGVLTKILEGVGKVQEAVVALDGRVSSLEKTPVDSESLGEESEITAIDLAAIVKGARELPKDQVERISVAALGQALIPDSAIHSPSG